MTGNAVRLFTLASLQYFRSIKILRDYPHICGLLLSEKWLCGTWLYLQVSGSVLTSDDSKMCQLLYTRSKTVALGHVIILHLN